MIVAIMTTALAGTAWAEEVTYSLTPDQASTGSTATSYIETLTEFTYNGISWKMNQWNPKTLQIKTNQSSYTKEFFFFNSSAFSGRITQVVLSFKALTVTDANKLLFKGGTSPVTSTGNGTAGIWDATSKTLTWTPASSDVFTYFAFYQNGYAASGSNFLASSDAIVVTYENNGSTLEDNDLALAPAALSFDLYNNNSAKTINYTTSSSGAVTVSASDYVNCEVNETAKTITVTPTAVTSGSQTITVNQAADDTYKSGTATFTVTVDDSTPFTGATFDATIDKGTSPIVKDNLSFVCDNGVLNNGSEYRLYKNSTTTISATDGSFITKIEFTGTSSNPASGFGSQTGWTTSGNNGVWEGEAESVSFVASGAQVRATLIKVWLKPNTNPFIAANNVNIPCNAIEGAIAYTLTNPVADGVLTANTTSEWLTIGTIGETVPFTCEANATATARTATVTLTYTYGDNQTITKEVTVTQAGRESAGLAYATTSVTKFEGDANFTNALTNPHNFAVTYGSSDETVATVDTNGEVTILAVGTTTITASYLGDDTYLAGTASYTLVVNEPFVAEDGVFDFVEAANQGYDYGSGVPIAGPSSNEDFIYDDHTWIAGNVTLVSSGKYRWWYNGHELRFYKTENDTNVTNGTAMTITVPRGKKITNIVISGGKDWTADCGTYTSSTGTWTGSSPIVVFTAGGSTNNYVTKVVVTYEDVISVTFNASGYATFASSSPIDFSGAEAEGYTAWAITSANKTTGVINFSQITGAVAAGTGVLLMGEPSETVYPVVATSGETPVNNLLVGFTEATPVEASQYYGLKGDTFKKVNAGTVPAGKALLPASQVGTDVKAFTFNFEDDATGINNVDVNYNLNENIYNIAGQRLQKMQKGINIVNGKKVLK